jgi:nicotinamide-nucleotide amidase
LEIGVSDTSSTTSELSTQKSCALLAQALQQRGWLLACAESCTGGLIAAACTDLAGSSNWFERGFVT